MTSKPPRALIIGGSLGGLFVANLLHRIGWDVHVFERSSGELEERGGGIVLQPEVVEVFAQIGATIDTRRLGVRSEHRIVLAPDGTIASKDYAPQIQTSWSLIYSTLRGGFPDDRYHQGWELEAIRRDGPRGTVTAGFANGSIEKGDLLVGADGSNSMVRELLWPGQKPRYAGYVAWRGLLPEAEMPASARVELLGNFGFSHNKASHNLGYLVPGPGNDVRPGHRLYNWVWYRVADEEQLQEIMTDRDGLVRNHGVPEGSLADRWVDHLAEEAEELLPAPFRDVVLATRQPFAHSVRDFAADTLVSGRAILLGDAAAIPRPHTAASTSKAAVNALVLASRLSSFPDIDDALARWAPSQVTMGQTLMAQGSSLGDQLLFGRRHWKELQ